MKDKTWLNCHQEKADRANIAKTEFHVTESHELPTQLTSRHGALGPLAETFIDTLSTEGSVLMDIELRNSETILDLVSNF
jgi:signal transduction histidine kinase